MSYADSLTEADEFLTYEEGKLQGLKEIARAIGPYSFSNEEVETISRWLAKMITEQQTLVDEMRGEEE